MITFGLRGGGLLSRLIRDTGANVLAIAAASLVPLTALVGGGVDVSRAYMTKTQLQAACDAGVLAGRKAMGVSGTYGDDERAKADKMFDFNFDGTALKVSDVDFQTEDNEDGQVLGTATATLPTLVMQVFQYDNVDLEVTCMAELQLANADVMFVLDTTGSMAGSPIQGLRDAVIDFHKTMNEAVTDADTRVRYGFVPYSMTVNAGGLVASGELPTGDLVDSANYQSRAAVFNTPTYVATSTVPGGSTNEYKYNVYYNECNNWAGNYGNNPVTSSPPPGTVTTYTYSKVSGPSYWGGPGTCTRKKTIATVTYVTKYKFTTWRYKQLPLDTSAYKGLGSVAVATNVTNAVVDTAGVYDPITLAAMDGSTASGVGISYYSWDGCIEERDTVDATDFDPIPSGAYDLDINLEPEDNATRWRPKWRQLEYFRYDYNQEDTTSNRSPVANYCPAQMQELKQVELSSDPENVPQWLQDYVDGLVATGYTYHDIGMIWGGRLVSSRGVFADNVNEGNLRSVSRHVIFMTDGIMNPNTSGYNAYGIESLDNRVAPRYSSYDELVDRHTSRFLAACEEAKSQGTTVWVVAFNTALTDELIQCSSNGRAYLSNNTDELRATFKFIAAQVADLRLGE